MSSESRKRAYERYVAKFLPLHNYDLRMVHDSQTSVFSTGKAPIRAKYSLKPIYGPFVGLAFGLGLATEIGMAGGRDALLSGFLLMMGSLCLGFIAFVIFRNWRLAALSAFTLLMMFLAEEGSGRIFNIWSLNTARTSIRHQLAAERMSYAPGWLIVRPLPDEDNFTRLLAYDPIGNRGSRHIYDIVTSELNDSCSVQNVSPDSEDRFFLITIYCDDTARVLKNNPF